MNHCQHCSVQTKLRDLPLQPEINTNHKPEDLSHLEMTSSIERRLVLTAGFRKTVKMMQRRMLNHSCVFCVPGWGGGGGAGGGVGVVAMSRTVRNQLFLHILLVIESIEGYTYTM